MKKDRYLSITVDVEEWFHSNWFDSDDIINKYYNGNIPKTDVEDCIKKIIALFNRLNVRGTFFILGGTAERYPVIIDNIRDAGHEIASHGYYHNLKNIDPIIFKYHIKQFKKNIYSHPKGFRFPNYFFSNKILQILYDEGFSYDSSRVPSFNIPGWYGDPYAPLNPHIHMLDEGSIIEFPISVSPFLRLPGAGGWYLRNLSYVWTYFITISELYRIRYANIYFHNWEVSSNNPSISDIPFHVFRNTGDVMLKKISYLIRLWKKQDSIIIEPFEELLDYEINETC
jgi:peptidoglycan/xylan/chitin deacetylase (PgdA/CDA1 family)